MWMWLCAGKLKVETAHFQLPSASQKRAWAPLSSGLFLLTAQSLKERNYSRANPADYLIKECSVAEQAWGKNDKYAIFWTIAYWPSRLIFKYISHKIAFLNWYFYY